MAVEDARPKRERAPDLKPPEDLELCDREGCRNVTERGVCSRCRSGGPS
jgi:hypothetical protein